MILGTEFQALKDGYVTKARIYTSVNEGGNHTVRLWQRNGSFLHINIRTLYMEYYIRNPGLA